MKKLELNQMENLEGGKFWGWTNLDDVNWGNCAPDGLQYGTQTYYILWQDTGATRVVTRICQ